jgi:hypothetical protein
MPVPMQRKTGWWNGASSWRYLLPARDASVVCPTLLPAIVCGMPALPVGRFTHVFVSAADTYPKTRAIF